MFILLDIQTCIAKNGEETIKVNGLYLHSPYNPTDEAKHFIKKHYQPADIQLLVGYGKGYFYNELLKRKEEDELILILEPILREIPEFESVYMDEEKQWKNILISNIHVTDSINVIISPNYDKFSLEKVKQVLQVVKEHLNSNVVTANTIHVAAESWYFNFLNNIFYACHDKDISKLYKKYSCPIVIASGGPSLTKQLGLVKKYRNQIILLCSGTTINSLLKENIIPDYLVSVDGSIKYYQHFEKLKSMNNLGNMKLVYALEQHYKIRPALQSSEAYYFVSKVLETLRMPFKLFTTRKFETLFGGGSCANFAYSLALQMTRGNVAFIGQDLAYTDSKTHADNNLNSKIINEEFINNRKLFYAEGYYKDSEVLTDHVYFQMKRSFESLYNELDDTQRTFNCTEGGILIENFINMPFSKFLERNCTANSSQKTISSKIDTNEDKFNKEEFLSGFVKMIELFDRLEKILKGCVEKIVNNPLLDKKIVQFLGTQDVEIQQLISKTGASIAFETINIITLKNFRPKLDETDQEIYDRVYNQNYFLYNEMYKKTIEIREKVKEIYIYYQKEIS